MLWSFRDKHGKAMRLFRPSLGFALFCFALVLAAVPARQAEGGSVYADAVAVVSVSSEAPSLCCAGGADEGAPAGNDCYSIACSSSACDIADDRAYSPRSAFWRPCLVAASGRTLARAPDPRPPRAIVRIV